MKVLQSRGLIDALEESSKRGPFSLPYSWVKQAVFAVDVLVVALTGLAVGAVYGYLAGGALTEAATIACSWGSRSIWRSITPARAARAPIRAISPPGTGQEL